MLIFFGGGETHAYNGQIFNLSLVCFVLFVCSFVYCVCSICLFVVRSFICLFVCLFALMVLGVEIKLKEVMKTMNLREKCDVQCYGLGIKEIWEVPEENHKPGYKKNKNINKNILTSVLLLLFLLLLLLLLLLLFNLLSVLLMLLLLLLFVSVVVVSVDDDVVV